jgi:cysteine desulfuration protein SufE
MSDTLSVQEKEKQLIEEFAKHPDWEAKYKHIIQIGEKSGALSAEEKTEQNLVRGCQSQVWLTAALEGERIHFQADSDAAITRGLVAMLTRFYSGLTPVEILQHQPNFLRDIGLSEHLSPTRSNGLLAMIKQIKIYALAFQSKLHS